MNLKKAPPSIKYALPKPEDFGADTLDDYKIFVERIKSTTDKSTKESIEKAKAKTYTYRLIFETWEGVEASEVAKFPSKEEAQAEMDKILALGLSTGLTLKITTKSRKSSPPVYGYNNIDRAGHTITNDWTFRA